MRLDGKLKLVLPFLSLILLSLSYFQFSDGYQLGKKVYQIDDADIKLTQELSNVEGQSTFRPIDKNMQILSNLLKKLFDKFNISSSDKTVASSGIDRVGEFRDIEVTVRGDFWQQIYFLQQVKKNMREFVVIKQLNGNNIQALFNMRIYGRTN